MKGDLPSMDGYYDPPEEKPERDDDELADYLYDQWRDSKLERDANEPTQD